MVYIRLPAFIIVLLCTGCSKKGETQSFPLEKYEIDFAHTKTKEGNTLIDNCDPVLEPFWTSGSHVGVVFYNNSPLWSDPVKKDTIRYLNFGDTITVVAKYSVPCKNEVYFKLKAKKGEIVYSSWKNISLPSSSGMDIAGIYFDVASRIYNDSLLLKRFISLFETRFAKDTIRVKEEEMGSWLLTGTSAAELLTLNLHTFPNKNYKQFYLQGLKIQRSLSFNQRRIYVLYSMLNTVDEHLSKPFISDDDIMKYYHFLKGMIKEYEGFEFVGFEITHWIDLIAAHILLNHWVKFLLIESEVELLKVLLSSQSEPVLLLGKQMESLRSMRLGNMEETKNILLTTWRQYPQTSRTFFKVPSLYSLFPVAAVIDSLLLKTQSYKKTLSFIQQIKERLTTKDSLLIHYLEWKNFQLCIESDCHGMSNSYKGKIIQLSEIGVFMNDIYCYEQVGNKSIQTISLKNLIVVKKGTPIRDGVRGQVIRVLQEDLQGIALYDMGPCNKLKRFVKIKSEDDVFWVLNNDSIPVLSRPLFTSSYPSKLNNDLIVKELFPIALAGDFTLRDINNDQVIDLVGLKADEYAIDGRTMKTIWGFTQKNKASKFVTHIEDDMYFQEKSRLVKRSLNNETLWTLDESIPEHYGIFQYPTIRFQNKVFAFTSGEYLLEINDLDGNWLHTYKLPTHLKHYLDEPTFDGESLYLITRNNINGTNTLISINLKSRLVKSLFEYKDDGRYRSQIQIEKGKIYFNTDSSIMVLNKKDGAILNKFSLSRVGNFLVTEDMLLIFANSVIKVYKLDEQSSLKWEFHSNGLNTNILVKDNIIYAGARKKLLLLSLDGGKVLFELNLSFNADGPIKYFDNRILIYGENHLMVIGNR
jgi:hypothetical protein